MLLNQQIADNKLRRMALEIAERNHSKASLILMGIKDNGLIIANMIAEYLKRDFLGSIKVISIELDKKHPTEIKLSEEVDFNNASVVLVDDVANSGKTMLYALKPILEKHPSQIETLVLVERTYKKFPIAIDYVGLSVATTQTQSIIVEVKDQVISGAYVTEIV
jgi:pyrimidine operon attenuation protein/uracil phosphoribosyltransferase